MIYIHIPFCKTRCIYCDFHSGTDLAYRERYVDAVCQEIEMRRGEIPTAIKTIYLGGGTPSVLGVKELQKIFATIERCYDVKSVKEVSMECNPDDICEDFLRGLRGLPVNRLSIGVQSFDDGELKWMGRRHSAQGAKDAVRLCREAGYGNISIDLMFSLPMQTERSWRRSLEEAMSLGVEHISCYTLMYEEGSRLARFYDGGAVEVMEEGLSQRMFEMLCEECVRCGYEHYEISNFAKEGYRSEHNSAYWRHVPYLGVGAGAHSFDGGRRRGNVSDTRKYMEMIERGSEDYYDVEELGEEALLNEFLFTALRTVEGVDLEAIETRFGKDKREYVSEVAEKYVGGGEMELRGGRLRLTKQGLFVSDMVMSDFMVV